MWTTQPAAATFLLAELDQFRRVDGFVRRLAERMKRETGTRLYDWISRFTLPEDAGHVTTLEEIGYETSFGDGVWRHPGGLFPEVELSSARERRLYIKVESVADFVLAHGLAGRVAIAGEPLAAVREALVAEDRGGQCWVVQRHGTEAADPAKVLRHYEELRLRRRDHDSDEAGFEHARELIHASIAELGVDRSCDLFFQCEREYWQMRNHAARVQKARQDRLGLGWANHDHHTYRSSRQGFASLIEILEELGFQCRERFYAGREAGWGAQVLEQPDVGVIIFADVDLSPEEVTEDFAHQPLPPREELGTVGLWCALHGEAFLQAGMHHLECQFDFDAAREQLQALGVESMKPFTDFAYLKQAFTVGEIWPVTETRLNQLLSQRRISEAQADKFRLHGAIGSHLEILQRDDGYKGFNQTGINEIILKTDPRRAESGSL
jgi:hypothetical protein